MNSRRRTEDDIGSFEREEHPAHRMVRPRRSTPLLDLHCFYKYMYKPMFGMRVFLTFPITAPEIDITTENINLITFEFK